jgi:hypothetical protein
MSSLPVRPTAVQFDESSMWVDLSDSRVPGVPLAWFARLFDPTVEQREQVRLSAGLERMHGWCTPKARRSEAEIQGFFASLRMTKCMVGQQS